MNLPRWTAYAALAVIFAVAITAVPKRAAQPAAPAPGALSEVTYPRLVVLGIDGMDPDILADVIARYPGQMTNFERLAQEGGIHSLGTSTPPQSPVAWSNFITGRNPGGHGIYDFIHRNPVNRHLLPSTSTEGHTDEFELWGDWQFPIDDVGESNRSGKAFWTILAEQGVPADIWRMPANFPVEEAKGLSFSGMMTPAIDSAYGECTYFTTDPPPEAVDNKRIVGVTEFDGRINTRLTGPDNSFKQGRPATSVPLVFMIDREANAVAIDCAGQVLVLEPGEWSQFVSISYDMLPLGLMGIGGEVRFYLRSLEPEFELYASPVNIDPSNPAAPVSEPSEASADLADPYTGIGPYYTQGMPEDVNALKSEVLTPPEFMDQAKLVHDEGERMMEYALDHYLDEQDGGLLFFYYSSVDLCCHMMWRHTDAEHPHHDAAFAAQDSSGWSARPGSTWSQTVDDLYLQMDPVLGRLRERVGPDTPLIVMSDHGFAPYSRRFSLNTWLLENGYLVLQPGVERELAETDSAHKVVNIAFPGVVDWSKTRAYGVGFNALYLNLEGREQDNPDTEDQDEGGIVRAGAEAEALLLEIKTKLEALRDDEEHGNVPVVLRADLASSVFEGERLDEAPDIIVGYNYGYGNSDEASQGQITHSVLLDNNMGGTFNGSHLMSPDVVQGILMTNGKVLPGDHQLEDLTVQVLSYYGIEPGSGMDGHPVLE